jgi:hypothetical protein
LRSVPASYRKIELASWRETADDQGKTEEHR